MLGMTQPRGWWFESGGEQHRLEELATIRWDLLLYANVFMTTAACCDFIGFVHVNYK